MVEKYDTDKSGEIEFDEFALMMGRCIFDQELDAELNESFLVFQKGREDRSVTARDIKFIMKKFGYDVSKEEA